MDFNDFPATQVCEKNDDFEPTQNTQNTGNSDNDDRKQVGVLIVGDTEYPIFTGTNTIGRHASNNIVLKDSTISKHHAEIEGRKKNSFICDLKSCNTTVLNKEKLLPNRLFELSDGALLRIGSISAIYRKLSSLNESILKTPAAARCNEIIASTPDSVLNTTDDDSSVVYGTQKNSAGSSEFRRPSLPPQRVEFNRRNLSLEFLSDDSLLNSETGSTSIYEQETQAFPQPKKSDSSRVNDLDTKEYSVNKPSSSHQASLENSQEILEADTQAVPLNSKSLNTDAENLFTDDDIILEANTQAVSVNFKPQNEHLNQDCEIEDEGIFSSSTQQVSSNSDKILQEATQAFAFKSPVSQSKKLNKYSEASEEISEDASVSTKSGNIHDETTQACPLESPKSGKSDKFEDKMIIEDSDTDEEGIFEEATQKVPASRKIYEELTQVDPLENPIKTGILGSVSRTEDSDTDEDGIFESSTHKYTASSPKKIYEEATQAFVVNVKSPILSSKVTKPDSNLNNSDTDEEGIFEKSTQAVSPNKSGSKSDLSLKSFSKSNRISAEPESNILNDSKTDEENFSKPQQKYSSNKEIENLNISGSEIAASSKVNLSLNELSTDDEGSFRGFLGQKENSNFKEVEEKIEADKKLSISVVELFRKADAKPEDSDTDDEGIFKKKLEDKNHSKTLIQKENVVESENSEPESKDCKSGSKNTAEDSETDDEGIFKKKEASPKELEESKYKISVQENVSVSKNSKSVFENSSKVDSKTPEDSETDDEGIFQKEESSTKEFKEKKFETIQREKMQESNNSNSESKDSSASKNSKSVSEISAKANSKNAEDSETEFIFQKRVSIVKKYKGKKQLKTPTQKEKLNESDSKSALEISKLELKISGKNSLEISKLELKISGKNSKTVEDSETDDEGIFENESANELHEKKSTTHQEEQMPQSKNSKTELKISSKDSETVDDSETDDEGIFQKEESKVKKYKENQQLKTPAQQFETDNEGIFRKKESNTNELKEKKLAPIQKKKSPIQKEKTPSKPSTSKEPNLKVNPLQSEIDNDGPTRIISFHSSERESFGLRNRSIEDVDEMAPTQLLQDIEASKMKTPENKTSSGCKTSGNESNSEREIVGSRNASIEDIDEMAPTQLLQDFEASKMKTPENKASSGSKTFCNESNSEREIVGSRNASIEDIDEMAPTQRLEDFKASKKKTPENKTSSGSKTSGNESNSEREIVGSRNESIEDIDEMAPTQLLQDFEASKMKTPENKTSFSSKTSGNDSNSEKENFGSRNASIEDLDYEMAATQPLEDFETSKMKTPENKASSGSKTSGSKSNSKSETNSGRRSSRRSNPKMHDTIEENLNEMFEGEVEEIGEPSQMLTQQLENILEESQVNEELLQTPSTSRRRTARRIETSPTEASTSLSERSSRSKNSPQVCNFHFKAKPKPSSGLQVSVAIKGQTCKSSDESDDDFVPFLPKKVIRSSISLKESSNLKGGLKYPGSPSPSTSSELLIGEGLLKSSPSLTKNRKGRKGRQFLEQNKLEVKKLKGSNSIGNSHIHEEVEKLARSTSLDLDSDDEEFEQLKRIADRVLKTESVYVQNRNALNSKVSKVTKVEKVVERPSVFQVDADNCSPRMSKLNIIRGKKELKVASPPQKKSQNEKGSKDKTKDTHPLKKRPLKMSEEESDTSTGGRGKRLKVGETEELEITTLFARRSVPFDGSLKNNKKAEVEEKEVKEPKKNLKGKTKVKVKDLNSFASSTLNDSLEEPKRRGRRPKIQKIKDEAKVDSTINGRASKRMASSSSNSFADDSRDVSTSAAENLKVPSKPKKTKKTKKANLVANEVENEENEVKTFKTRRASKRQVMQSKEIISNSSSSSSLVETSFNGTADSKKEKLKKTEQKETATRGRKKKEASDMESMPAEKSSASSSMIYLTSGDGNSSALSTPTRAKRSRVASPHKHKVLFTGVSADNYRNCLKTLGLTETEDVNKFTVLVTDKVRRTLKFLRAASQGTPIVSVNWLVDSTKKNNIQELENYIVKDPAAEAKFGFNLSESLKKAREKKMLEGFTVVLTPNISAPPPSELKEMVLASGGKAVMRSPAKWLEKTVVLSDEKDLQNAKKFMAKAPKTVTLHSTEFLLTGILKQEVDLQSYVLKIK